jgi:signal transduction histidine kinase
VIKELIVSDILDTVVLLPQNIFPQTAIQTAIIVVNKEKTHRGFVRFIDASECFNKVGRRKVLDVEAISSLLSCDSNKYVRKVSNNDIIANNCDITPKLYTQSQEVVFPEGYEVVDFRDILEQCPTKMQYLAEDGYIAKIPQLSTDPFDCERSVEDFEYSTELRNVTKVEEPVILISRIREAKPTYCVASPEKPLFVHANVIPFRIKKGCEWVEPHFLCQELSNRIKNVFFGANIPSLSINRLVNVRLAFPSRLFDEQKRLFDTASYQRKLAKAQELGLQEVIEKLKAEYIDVVRSRAHDMRKYLRELSSFVDVMKNYIKPQSNVRLFSQDVMMEMMCYYEDNLNELSRLVDAFSREERFGEAEIFDVDEYFQQKVENHNNSLHNYVLNYYPDVNNFDIGEQDSNLVKISRDDFDRVVGNIMQNAEKHGFVETDRKDYKMDVFLSIDEQKDMFQIDFVNNGSPLPIGLTKAMYGINGKKAGRTGGTGVGGHIVKSFVEHFGGDYDLFMDNNEVVIRILLPIFRK